MEITEVRLSYRSKVKAKDRVKIKVSDDVYALLKSVYPKDTIEYKEYFKVILMNNANQVLGITHLSEGGVASTSVDIKFILQAAILANATAIIISHNHPSGNLVASMSDIKLTRQIKDAAGLFNIRLLDHIIISKEHFYSMADDGVI